MRRTLLSGLAATAVSASLIEPSRASEVLPIKLNPTDRSHLGLLQKKLIYAMDDRPLIWWIRGNKYGAINGELTPLWTLNVILFKSVKHNQEGSFDAKSMEVVYKTDVETDEPLKEFWDGTFDGKPVQQDTYVYRFETEDGDVYGYVQVIY